MVTSIARQSVIFKCTRQQSILIGNYEFYYLAGLMHKLFGVPCDKTMEPKELHNCILEHLKSLKPSNKEEEYLIQMVEFFPAAGAADEQMRELFEWGATENDLWKVDTEREGSLT